MAEIIIVPSAFFLVGFIVYVIVEGFRRRSQAKMVTEFHTKLLDRIGSAKEFGDFFASDAGRRFMDSLSSTDSGSPHVRILRSVQTGLVMLALGIGLFILTDQRTFSLEAMDGLVVTATVTAAIGAGLIASTLITYLLSWQMGLLSRRSKQDLEPRQSQQ
ncbi:MAG TPA: hypothetical protein VFB85_15255 [Vicinamibacterales bacterium]|jgi:hypothetical protein|nr:hypothetical protein [Vicinamibacterales bacterium]